MVRTKGHLPICTPQKPTVSGSSCHHEGELQDRERHVYDGINILISLTNSWTFLSISANNSHLCLTSLIISMQKNPVQYTLGDLWQCLDTRPAGIPKIGASMMVPFCYNVPDSLESSPIPYCSGADQTWYLHCCFPLPRAQAVLPYAQIQIPTKLKSCPTYSLTIVGASTFYVSTCSQYSVHTTIY